MKKNLAQVTTLLFLAASVWGQEAAASKGIEQYEAHDYAEAEKSLRAAMEAEPEDWRAPYYLGLTLVKLQRPAEALRAFDLATEKPDANLADIKLGQAQALIAQKEFAPAERQIQEAARINSEHKDLAYTRGLLFLARRDFSNAARQFEATLARDPRNAYAHYYAGMAYNGLKRPDRMVAHFDTFLKLAPTAPEAAKVQSVLRSVR
ncbi:MAG: tetratricopeptide repeat protein [Bryobacteraceae bacterium]|nr:tetratricopeptide repeat protein [Bryobacteraceae bacterium]MDW8379971.1 tetratricopeptide repeat protein [Bryobacterales bacterium]